MKISGRSLGCHHPLRHLMLSTHPRNGPCTLSHSLRTSGRGRGWGLYLVFAIGHSGLLGFSAPPAIDELRRTLGVGVRGAYCRACVCVFCPWSCLCGLVAGGSGAILAANAMLSPRGHAGQRRSPQLQPLWL